MIEPRDDDEKQRLIRELVVERFGRPPKRAGTEDGAPKVIARRRRVLLDAEKSQETA